MSKIKAILDLIPRQPDVYVSLSKRKWGHDKFRFPFSGNYYHSFALGRLRLCWVTGPARHDKPNRHKVYG